MVLSLLVMFTFLNKLFGFVTIKDLVRASARVFIDSIMRVNLVTVSPDTIPELVAHLAIKYNN